MFCALLFLSQVIAPQAPFEESATTEASRRCPLTGFLREIGVLFSGHVLEAFATGICVLAVQNSCSELLRISPILSVCLSVCYAFFAAPFWSRSMDVQLSFQKNSRSKKGSATDFCRGSGAFPGPRLCHLAEVVALSSNGDCGATPLSVCLVATLVTIT